MKLGRIILYTRRIDEVAAFYCRHFGFEEVREAGDRIVALVPSGDGAEILLHPASKGQRQGPSVVKLVFDVADVPGFHGEAAQNGLHFGTIHEAAGYVFANAKDPAGNSISISSRVFRPRT